MTYEKLLKLVLKNQTLKESKIFTEKQLNKLVELVACSYIYNIDMGEAQPSEQRLLKNIYQILTGREDPEDER